MKKLVLAMMMLFLIYWLAAQVRVQSVVVNGKNPVVTRCAITLSQESGWSYVTDTQRHIIRIKIDNAGTSQPVFEGVTGNYLISRADYTASGQSGVVQLYMKQQFFIETMTVSDPFKIVLDLFVAKSTYSYNELYAQAQFYESVGKRAQAAHEYELMLKQYPQMQETNLYYARLLLKMRNTEKAKQKLSAIPANNRTYQEAQALLAGLNGKPAAAQSNTPASVANPATKSYTTINKDSRLQALEHASPQADTSVAATPALAESVKAAPAPQTKKPKAPAPAKPRISVFLLLAGLPLWVWFIVGLIILIAIFIILDIRHLKHKVSPLDVEDEGELHLDSQIMARMVQKLVMDGWNSKEIARELRISVKEVEAYIKQSQKRGSNYDNIG